MQHFYFMSVLYNSFGILKEDKWQEVWRNTSQLTTTRRFVIFGDIYKSQELKSKVMHWDTPMHSELLHL